MGKLTEFFKKLFSGKIRVSRDIGIDLGTATVLVYVEGKGIVLKEPSVVAVDTMTDKVFAVGREAQQMLGRTPENITAFRPLRDGVISQYEITINMLEHFIRRACKNIVFQPRVVICIPSGITDVEERAVLQAGRDAGARRTYLIEEPLAAAIGVGIDISAPVGHMIVDIGGGTTDVAVISLGGIVASKSVRIAGDKFDEAIMKYVRRKYNVLIGERTAETVKIRIGTVFDRRPEESLEIKGRSLADGQPKVITLSSGEMIEALAEPASAVLDAIYSVIERTPPELIGDIMKNGIIMTGGGSQLSGLDRLITKATGIRARVAKNPESCVAMGTGRALSFLEHLPEGTIRISDEKIPVHHAGSERGDR